MGATKRLTQAARASIDVADCAGPDRSYPCDTRAHARAAIRLYGRAAHPDTVRRNIIQILRRKGWDDLIPAAWQAKKGVTMSETLVHFGGAVKSLGDGKVGGYLITFSDAAAPDLTGEYFTKATDFDLDDGKRTAVYYAHGLDPKIGARRIGTGTMKADEVGVWVEAQLNLRDAYEERIYAMAQQGKLGWSSGTANHLVTRKAITTGHGRVAELQTWPLGLDASLTPTPAEPRCDAIALKALGAMLGIDEAAANHTKALPAGMAYNDLLTLLSDELNEDFPDTDDDGTDPWGPGLHIRDVYDESVIYADADDLYRIPYTVTPGNDVTWGTPQAVVRATTYLPVTEGDDEGMDGMADVTALKAMLTRSMTFGDHAEIATSAMEGFVTRAAGLTDLAIKAGRVISSANRAKLQRIHAGMMTAHTAMESHLEAINTLLLSTDPDRDAKKDAEAALALRVQSLRLQSQHLRMTG